MWVITLFSEQSIRMFEFETESEANVMFNELEGNKVLSHVVYYNDPVFA